MAPPRPWSRIPIRDDGEPLEALPPDLLRLEPHPYRSLGAPYGEGDGPFRLRRGVVERLRMAEAALRARAPSLRLGIYDAWRPLAVQRFMVTHAIDEECRRRGIDPRHPTPERLAVEAEVGRFWAPPSEDPATPPPHSTGAAVDLTLTGIGGTPVAMGGAIDAIGPISEPDHHAAAARERPHSLAATWHSRRQLLAAVMEEAGFVRHPNEWWHFSHGDQLWAWSTGAPAALYGRTRD